MIYRISFPSYKKKKKKESFYSTKDTLNFEIILKGLDIMLGLPRWP